MPIDPHQHRRRRRRAAAALAVILLVAAYLELQKEKPRYRPPILYRQLPEQWSLDAIEDSQFTHLMRFSRQELRRIMPLFRLDRIKYRHRYCASPEEGLGVVLMRMTYPRRYWEMMSRFGHSRSWISVIFQDTIVYLFRRFRRILQWDEDRLTYTRLSRYAYSIYKRGITGLSIWGWIDGTFIETCRPEVDQEYYYSGHKKAHGFKYQGIATPDGLISSLMGPFLGKDGDWRMVMDSELPNRLKALNQEHEEDGMLYVYGDPAYSAVYGILGPFKNYPSKPRSPDQTRFNLTMSKLRIEVEHAFGKHLGLFQLMIKSNELKVRQGASMLAGISILFANIHTCLRGSQTCERFDVLPPEPEIYLRRNADELAIDSEQEKVQM